MSSANRSKNFELVWQKRKKKTKNRGFNPISERSNGVTKQSQVSSYNPTPYQRQAIDSNIDNDPVTTQIILIWTIIMMT
jgi:hypothetical protein